MAENVTLDPTTTSGGAVIHTDELSSGAHVQRVKIGTGNPGVYSDVDSSNPLPITGDVSVGNTVAVSNAGLTELAAAINANELDVNLASSAATVTVTGSVDASVGNTVTVAGTVAATQSGSWSVTVGNTVTVTGTVTATPSGIQDVSVGNTVSVSGTVTANAGSGTMSVSDGAVVSKLDNVSVTIVSDGVGIGGGTQYSEGTPFVSAVGNAALLIREDAPATIQVDNDWIAQRATQYGAGFVQVVNSSGSFVDTFGGGTQYSEGTAVAEVTGTGNMLLARRDDALSALSVSEGQVVGLRTDNQGALWVTAAPGDAETTDGATVHSLGVTRQVNVGFISQPNELSVGANIIGMAGMNSERAIYVSIKEDSVGIGGGTQYSEGTPVTTAIGNANLLVREDAPVAVEVDGDWIAQRSTGYGAAFVQIVDSAGSFVDTFGGGTQYSVGTSGLTSAGVGNLMIAVRDDSLTTLASGEGQGVPLRVSSTGALHVTGGGGGTEYTEDVAAAGDPVGGAVILVRADTPGTITSTDGDNIAQRATNYGAAFVQLVTSSGSFIDSVGGGTEYSVGTPLASEAGLGKLIVGIRDDALGGLTEVEGTVVPARFDANGAMWVIPSGTTTVDNGGTFAVQAAQSGSWSVTVGNTVTVTGTVTADAGAGTLNVSDGAVVGALSGIALAANQLPDGHNVTIDNAAGAAAVNIQDGGNIITVDGTVAATQSGAWSMDASVGNTVTVTGTVAATQSGSWSLAANQSVNVAQMNGVATTMGNGASGTGVQRVTIASDSTGQIALTAAGGLTALQLIDNPILAHDSPVGTTQTNMVGARATNNIEGLTQVAANDGTRITADLNGCIVTRPHTTLEESVSYHDQTVTTGSIVVSSGFAAGGAGVHNYITDIECTNSSATDTVVQIRDGGNGAVLWTMSVPANGGNNRSFAMPLKQPTANTALAFDPLTAVTTLYISINGFQAQG